MKTTSSRPILFALTLLLISFSVHAMKYCQLGDDCSTGDPCVSRVWGIPAYASDDPAGDKNAGRRITFQYLEPAIGGSDMPLVIALHGNGGDSGSFCDTSFVEPGGWPSIVDLRNEPGKEFVLACVDGHPPIPKSLDLPDGHWHYHYSDQNFNDGDPASPYNIDHVVALDNVITELHNIVAFDTSRIYVAGFSGGALMTHLLAMEGLPNHGLAAAATIASALGGVKNYETVGTGNPVEWDAATGGYQIGSATTFADCAADPYCYPIPSNELRYPSTDPQAVPMLIMLGDSDPHFPLQGEEDLSRFEDAAAGVRDNGDRTGVGSLADTVDRYREKNGGGLAADCPLSHENLDHYTGTGSVGFKVTTYGDAATCGAVIKVVEMEGWAHQLTKGTSDFVALRATLRFFDEFGADPVNGGGGGLGL